MSFIDEFEGLILRDVQKEGYMAAEEEVKVKERKLKLLKALQQALYDSVEKAKRDWRESNAIVLWTKEE